MENGADMAKQLISCVANMSRALVISLFVLHVGLVAWIDATNSPNPDETAHLAAGADVWQSGRFDLYPVNPPLVRALAALPIVYGCTDADWASTCEEQRNMSPRTRSEFSIGIGLVRNNPDRVMWFFTLSRLACIPLSVIGGYFCWRWASELYGNWAGVISLVLWCFSPNVIAWSATICPDVAAASFGIAACYFFWRWLKEPEWFGALLAGIVLGLAELTKMTWIILFVVWPLIWMVWLWGERRNVIQLPWYKQSLQLASNLAIGLFVINLGYSFGGTFTRLGDFTFVSHTLAGADSIVDGGKGGNRFTNSWLDNVPVPLPKDYVEGMDLQKVDFERGLPSYLFGQWSQHGWWYYYIVCAVLKVPLGTWAVALLAVVVRLGQSLSRGRKETATGDAQYRVSWLDELVLLLPAIVLFVFVSSQTGFSRHFRYVLPAVPFLFVWIGSVAQTAMRKPRTIGAIVTGVLMWMVTSSLSIYPHSMSYFNELAGGPMGGPRYLLDANIDWGQDALYLKDWCEKHPEATPIHVAFGNSYSDVLLQLGERVRNLNLLDSINHKQSPANNKPRELGPKPGWYAVSVHRIYDSSDHYQYFQQFTPVATAGYSIYIYHITLEEANLARRAIGVPALSFGEVAEI